MDEEQTTTEASTLCPCGREVTLPKTALNEPTCVGCGYVSALCRCVQCLCGGVRGGLRTDIVCPNCDG
jgi:hypothetical protein